MHNSESSNSEIWAKESRNDAEQAKEKADE